MQMDEEDLVPPRPAQGFGERAKGANPQARAEQGLRVKCRMHKYLFSGLASVFCVGLIGCAPSNSDQSVLIDGKKNVQEGADGQIFQGTGYTVTMPKNWTIVDFTKKDWREVTTTLKKDPNFDNMSGMIEGFAQNKAIKLFATIPEATIPGFSGNVNIIDLQNPPGTNATFVFDENAKQLTQLTGAKVEGKPLTIANAEAQIYEFQMKAMGNTLAMTTVVAVQGGRNVTITFSVPEERKKDVKSILDPVVKSITFN